MTFEVKTWNELNVDRILEHKKNINGKTGVLNKVDCLINSNIPVLIS